MSTKKIEIKIMNKKEWIDKFQQKVQRFVLKFRKYMLYFGKYR